MTLGGVDAADVPGDGWRRAVALVGEHDHVFATTLRAATFPSASTTCTTAPASVSMTEGAGTTTAF